MFALNAVSGRKASGGFDARLRPGGGPARPALASAVPPERKRPKAGTDRAEPPGH
jgi:hypothetical protein